MSRQEKLNILFSQNLGEYLSKNLAVKDSLVTVKEVDIASDLNKAEVKVSILPTKLTGSTLELLRKISKEAAFAVSKKINLRKVPKIVWLIDSSEEKAEKLNKLFDKINQEKK